jgi:hypothetical protein
VAAAQGDMAAAREHFLRGVHLLTAVGADRKAAESWFELGGHLRDVGDIEAAMDAYRRAAASTGLVDRARASVATTGAGTEPHDPPAE